MIPELYIDSAERERVAPLLRTGLAAGVTTNPAILDKAGLRSADIPGFVAWALDTGAQRVFVQAWGTSADELVDRGSGFRLLSPQVVVKVPASLDGITAARRLAADGEVLVTAVHSAGQLPPIMASGATWIAPFVARMTAAGRDGVAETLRMRAMIAATGSPLRVLAGSLRTSDQLVELLAAGVGCMTLGPDVWDALFDDEPTAAAVENFQALATR